MRPSPIHILLAIFCLTFAHIADARTVWRLERKHFVGAWQGYCPDFVWDFARMALDADGGGFLAVSDLPNTPVNAYRVRWQYADGRATVALTPVKPSAPKITLHDVQQTTNAIEFELRGEGYKRKMHLFNAADLEGRIADTTKRIKEARSAARRSK